MGPRQRVGRKILHAFPHDDEDEGNLGIPFSENLELHIDHLVRIYT